ncbi:DUF3072 domain-containing protein [Tropicibacter naphthalenivorans]|uniref:DUF3072 domain-containing protein n=1 Tax=Tropicibacter naphthalenivorans TaxID=441103 RepID=A0A0P1GKH2_9RHOB|nr:DUF3072 domain-containing protein [Tropicibacter naphthalenivorans]CUH75210.1 hypothetical protein TRN7648_00323 [Tropicibacter naphthalenivorans]SMC45586.1 Protein of unknown function [Tropicibacter naphthalenivorans]
MTDKIDPAADLPPDPRDPMTPEQAERLRALSEPLDEPVPEDLTVREADRRIECLEDFATC